MPYSITKKTDNWLNVNRVQFPLRSTDYGLIRKISYKDGKVKLVDVNSTALSKYSKEKKPPQGGSFNGKPITAKSITDSKGNVTKEADIAYGEAVKRGDMETAQKFVDAALEAKGFTEDV